MSAWTKTKHPSVYSRPAEGGGRRYRVVYYDAEHRQRSKDHGTLAAALAFQGRARSVGIPAEHNRATCDQTFEAFMALEVRPKGSRRRGNTLAPKTAAGYRSQWAHYISPVIGKRRIATVRRQDLAALLSSVQPRRATAADSTRVHVYRLLMTVFSYAVWDERIPANPCAALDVREGPRREPRFLTAAEVDALAEELPECLQALARVAAWCGPRIGELAALRVRHLDYLHRRVIIAGATSFVEGRRVEGPTKTGKTRAVPVPTSLWDELVAHVARFSDPSDPDAPVFPMPVRHPSEGRVGGLLNSNNFRRRYFDPAARAAGISPPPTVHDLRHTAASLMAASGYSLAQAGAVLGHSTVSMTQRYSHLYEGDLAAATLRLDASRRAGGSA